MTLNRYKISVSYDGTDFFGFECQREQNLPTIGQSLEDALNRIIYFPTKDIIPVFCAGRTDTGVHALNMICHFDIDSKFDKKIIGHSFRKTSDALQTRLNAILPNGIVIKSVEKVSNDFHARFNAIEREYWYNICDALYMSSALNQRFVYQSKYKLDIELMNNIAKEFIGLHDFTSFIKYREKQSPIREILSFDFQIVDFLESNIIQAKIIGKSFGHNMIRSLMNGFIMLGSGQRTSDWLIDKLNNPMREGATGPIASKGLIFANVTY